MDPGQAARGGDGPAEIYSHRLQELNRAQTAEQRREKRLGYAKLTVAGLTLICAALLLHHLNALELLLVPVCAFIGLAVLHEKVIQSIRARARTIAFYESGVARLNDRWAGTGEKGERFLDPAHPYARDLDLFGRASLFELLCTARTRAGEETLASWLLAAAPVEEVIARQDAIRDLKDRVSFREKLFALGETVRLGVKPASLAAWGERDLIFGARSTRVTTGLLGVAWILSLVCWGVWDISAIAVAISLLNLAWAHLIYTRLDEAAESVEKFAGDLELFAGVLALLEREHFSSPKLLELQTALRRDGVAASLAIRNLARIAEYLKQRHNLILRPLDFFTFWSAQLVFAAERWQQSYGRQICEWLRVTGELEALTALSGYAYEHPKDVFPEFAGPELFESRALFDAEGMTHPLLPADKSVRNDLKLGDGLQLIILSGPNMAGKSTFIRCIGVNAVLAQCGAPVCATRLRLSPLAVAASICILDSLSGGVSRFYAEIRRIKLVSDLTRGPVPVLFLLDELLSGTNSHDRLAGTEFVVRSFVERGAIGMVSTHDLALARIPAEMGERAGNFHFEDRFENGQLIFNYKLKPGIVQTSNALELMRSIGLIAGS
jgi:hypothetical protein